MEQIIDTHIHLYPPDAAADPGGWAARREELHWAELVVGSERRPSLQGWADPERLLSDMAEAGVTGAVSLGWYWENQDTCEEQNRWMAREAGIHAGKLWWFASAQPRAGLRAVEEIRRAASEGAIGIGELSPAAQGYSLRDPCFRAVADVAVELGLVLNIHVNEVLGRERAGRRFDRLEDFQWLAREYPQPRVILAHWGGMIPFFELNNAVKRDLRNVFYDTAASPLLYEPRVYRLVCNAVGKEKLIFGSDYPLVLYPRRGRRPGFGELIREVRESGLSDDERRALFSENAARVLALKL